METRRGTRNGILSLAIKDKAVLYAAYMGIAAASLSEMWGDITTGLPRVEELFEAWKTPKGEAVVSEIGGVVFVTQSDRYSDLRIARVEHSEMIEDEYALPEGSTIGVEDGSEVDVGDVLAHYGEQGKTEAINSGRVRIEDSAGSGDGNPPNQKVIVAHEMREVVEYELPTTARVLVKDGNHIEAGEPITEGSLNPHRILRIQGRNGQGIGYGQSRF